MMACRKLAMAKLLTRAFAVKLDRDVLVTLAFDPSQKRATDGKWTDGGYAAAPKAKPRKAASPERAEKAVRKRLESVQRHSAALEKPSASRDRLDTAASKALDYLSEDEVSAMTGWTGFSYEDIRAADRGDPNVRHHAKVKASQLRGMINQFDYEPEGAVHRGMRVDAATARKLLNAKSMNIDTMTSWSASGDVAKGFAQGTSGTALKGTTIPVVMTMTRGRGLPIGGPEAELLVGKNQYKIVSRSNDNGILRIHVEPKDAENRHPAVIRVGDDDMKKKGMSDKRRLAAKKSDAAERFGSSGDDVSFPAEDDADDKKKAAEALKKIQAAAKTKRGSS